ncbi:MAG: DUF6262 family protein [Candidatus Dormibacteria bacterium]
MSETPPPRTAAALAARRHNTQNKLDQVRVALTRLRRENSAITFPAIARRATVSRTFLYENAEARALVEQALTRATASHAQARTEHDTAQEAAWRERALNAEDALKAAHAEIRTQRSRIGTLIGNLRDLEQNHPHQSVEHLTAENTTLKHRVHQLAQDNRILEERLHAARSNLRFQDRRLADLEAKLLDNADHQ